MVWNYSERKNKTIRINRLIRLNLNANEQHTKQLTTNPTQKYAKSIYDKIGNILERNRI